MTRYTLIDAPLSLVRGLGHRMTHAPCTLSTPEAILDCRREELEANGVPAEVADDILSAGSADRAMEEWEKAETLGIRILDLLHPDYPFLLREIYDPPCILYIRGKRWDSSLPQVLRDPPADGLWHTAPNDLQKICREGSCGHFRLPAAWIPQPIVALRAGVTYAVFGCGLDFIYPARTENRGNTEEKARQSRNSAGHAPRRRTFPFAIGSLPACPRCPVVRRRSTA
jgi:DNA processing protein